jgi:hypothetical protein
MMSLFPSGERFVLVEGPPHGIAVMETTVDATMSLRERGLSPNTMYLHMQAVTLTLDWAWNQHPRIDLHARIEAGDLLMREEVFGVRRELRCNLMFDSLKDPKKRKVASEILCPTP